MNVLINNEKDLQGLFFQDEAMKQAFAAYPELLCIDATYKLLELRLPLYIMLAEDGNGQSEIVCAFLLLEETEDSLSTVASIFKEMNPAWRSVRVLMADKDITEREVLAGSFPHAELLICLYHTFRSFRREISSEKMGITSGQRNMCLEMLQQMAYAPSEQKYTEMYSQFKRCAPSTVVEYFDQSWHPIRKQWTMGMKYSTGNFLNSTNNRLESLNAKLKSVISRYSSLEEFVEKFFLILRVLRSERDHATGLTAQKIPVAFHSTTYSSSIRYMQYLTPYAYKFVAKQMALKAKVKIVSTGSEQCCVESNDGTLSISLSTCECTSWKSMRLPCRHILAVRTAQNVDLFDEALCDTRWSMDYYRSSQRVFTANMDEGTSQIAISSLPTAKKKPVSQVMCDTFCVWFTCWISFVLYFLSLRSSGVHPKLLPS